jgi:hypothetical protein
MVQDDGLTTFVGSFIQDKKELIILSCPSWILCGFHIHSKLVGNHSQAIMCICTLHFLRIIVPQNHSLGRILPADTYNPTEHLNHILAQKDELETRIINPEDYKAWAFDILGSDAVTSLSHLAWQQIFYQRTNVVLCPETCSR